MKTTLFAFAALIGIGACATEPASAWTEVGVRDVGNRADHDVVQLNGHRLYDRIKLCVYRNPVHFMDLNVSFNNGGDQPVPVRSLIPAGGCTRVIDLSGGQRDIARIDMIYREGTWRRRTATVRVFAE